MKSTWLRHENTLFADGLETGTHMEILDLFHYLAAKGTFQDKKMQGKLIMFFAIIFFIKDSAELPSC